MKLFYARCSTADQNEARQLETANEIGADKVFIEKISGKDKERPQLLSMLDFAREGDTVYCSEISRLARSTRDLLYIIDKLSEKKVQFVSVKENIDTTTPQGQFMLTVFAALAELERETILQRQREGIAIAKAAGKYTGRKRKKIDSNKMAAVCTEWRSGKITGREAAARIGVSTNTFYRRVKEFGL